MESSNAIKEQLQALQEQLFELKSSLLVQSEHTNEILSSFSKDVEAQEIAQIKTRDIETVPGARTPKWYVVDIDFDSGETQAKTRSLEISPDGAFVCTQMQVYYKVLDSSALEYGLNPETVETEIPNAPYLGAYGRYIPCTTAYFFCTGTFFNPIASAPTTPNPTSELLRIDNALYPFPEFSFQFEQPGIGFWANKPIPAACFYGVEESLFMNTLAYIDRRARLTVTAKPEARVPLKGTVRIVFHGYQILGNLDLPTLLNQ